MFNLDLGVHKKLPLSIRARAGYEIAIKLHNELEMYMYH
jgi:hypothetical protein